MLESFWVLAIISIILIYIFLQILSDILDPLLTSDCQNFQDTKSQDVDILLLCLQRIKLDSVHRVAGPSRNTSVTAGERAGGQPRQFRLTLRSEATEALGQGDVWDWLGWWEQPPPAQDPRLCLSDKLSTCSAPLSPQWSGLSPPSLLRAHHPPAQPVLPGSFFPFIPTASASLPQPAVSLLTPQGTQGCLE